MKRKQISKSERSKLFFPVGRLIRELRVYHKKRVSVKSAIAIAAVLEYLVAEILDISVNLIRQTDMKRINPEIILKALRSDHELCQLFEKKEIVSTDNKQNLIVLDVVGRGVNEEIQKRILNN